MEPDHITDPSNVTDKAIVFVAVSNARRISADVIVFMA